MAQYDGSIRINTEINAKNAESQLSSLENRMKKTADKIASLRSKMESLKDVKIPTQEYKEVQKQIEATEKKINDLVARQEKFLATGGKESSSAFQRMQYDLEELRNSLPYLKGELQDLVETGKAFTLGKDTEEYDKLRKQLKYAENDMDSLKKKHELMLLKQVRSTDEFKKTAQETGKVAKNTSLVNSELGKIDKSSLGLSKRISSISSGLKGTLRTLTGSVQNIDKGFSALRNSLGGLLGSLGFGLGIAGLVALGKQAIDTASDIQEVQDVVDTAFGSMSYKMEEFAKTSVKQFGISRLSAKQLGSTFMAMGKSMLGSAENASNMAINLTARAADMASFYNKSIEETSTALKSIYTGETESLKEYGVVMTQVNLQEFARQQGISKSIQKMTQAEKVELQYAYVMKQTSLAAGDFARASGSWANQTRILSEQFKELSSIIGTGLIAALTPVVKFLNNILTQAIAIAKQIGAILSKLFGISIPIASAAKGTTGIASDMGDAADNMDSAAGSADDLKKGVEAAGKAAKKSLAPFDKLNVLAKEATSGKDSGSGGEGSTGAGGITQMPEVEMKTDKAESGLDAVFGKIQPIIDKLKELAGVSFEGFLKGLGDWKTRLDSIKDSIISIGESLIDIFTDPEVLSSADKYVESVANLLGTLVGATASIGLTIATNIVGGIEKYLEQNIDQIKEYLISMFNIWEEVNNLFSELFESIAFVFEAFASEQGQQLTANIIGIFTNAFMGITELASKLLRDIANIIIQPFVDNKESFRTALEGFLGVLSEVTGTIKQGIDDTLGKFNQVYDEHFKPLFDSIAEGLSKIVGKFLDFWNENVQPMLDDMAKDFDKLWKEHIQPLLNKAADFLGKVADLIKVLWEKWIQPLVEWIVDNVLPKILPVIKTLWNGLKTVVGNIADALGGIIDALGGVIDFLTGVFSGDWEKAWGGIKTFFNGIWTAIKNIVKAAINVVKTVISTALSAIKSVWDVAWKAIKTIASNAWSGIKSVFSGIGGWFKGKFDGAVKNIKSAFSGVAGFFEGVWSNIKGAFGNITEWFRTKFSKAWEAVKKVFSTGGKVFSGIKDGILSGLKSVINALIGGINKVITIPFNGINAALKKLKNLSIVGQKPFGFLPTISVPQIPKLANGAVIRGGDPFMAVLGDQPRGQTNIETPLPTMIKAFKQAMAESGGMGAGNITVQAILDGKVIYEETVKQNNAEIGRTGRNRLAY